MIPLKKLRKLKETLDMPTDSELENLSVNLWRTVYQTYTRFKNGMDQVLSEYGLTMEQYLVLATIKYHDPPMRITDVAGWLERSTNSVTMIVDRMVKAGLLRRVRDRRDRRAVFLIITSKGEKALKPATLAGWEFIQKILSPLSTEDRQALLSLLLTVQYEACKHLNPGEDTEEIRRNEDKCHDELTERLGQYTSLSTPEAKRQGGKKGKTRG